MEINAQIPPLSKNRSKPKKIVVLQWMFLLLTLFTIWEYIQILQYLIYPVKDNYDVILKTIWLVPLFCFVGITLCLFLYTKRSMLFVVPLATVIVLSAIFLSQYVYFHALIKYWGIEDSDFYNILSPQTKEIMENNPSRVTLFLGFGGMIMGAIFFGIPFLLVFILHKVIQVKRTN